MKNSFKILLSFFIGIFLFQYILLIRIGEPITGVPLAMFLSVVIGSFIIVIKKVIKIEKKVLIILLLILGWAVYFLALIGPSSVYQPDYSIRAKIKYFLGIHNLEPLEVNYLEEMANSNVSLCKVINIYEFVLFSKKHIAGSEAIRNYLKVIKYNYEKDKIKNKLCINKGNIFINKIIQFPNSMKSLEFDKFIESVVDRIVINPTYYEENKKDNKIFYYLKRLSGNYFQLKILNEKTISDFLNEKY